MPLLMLKETLLADLALGIRYSTSKVGKLALSSTNPGYALLRETDVSTS